MSTQLMATRLDTFTVTLMVEDIKKPGNYIDWGIWDQKTGGDLDSEERLYYPGAMADPYSLGGRVLPQNITIIRNYRIHRDHYHVQQLIESVGKAGCIVTMFPMDKYGNTHTPAIVWRGTLKTVVLPEYNSETASDPGLIHVVITVDSPMTVVGANH